MNKIEQMLQELCPDGVEYKKLSDICSLSRGKVYSKTYLSENIGDYPVYSSQTANNGELGKISTYDYDGEFLTWTTDGAYAGTIFHRKGKFSITNVCGLISLKSKDVLIRFLYYWLGIEAPKHVYQGMGNPKLMSNQMEHIEIPVPPLPIQEEIIRILDHFTELTASLQAELQARQEQYEYYRNRLLTFNKLGDTQSVTWMKISEVAEIGTGNSNRQDAIADGAYPFFVRSKNVFHSGTYEFDEEAVIIPGEGGIGDIFHYVKGKYALHQRVYRIHLLNDRINTRFLYYYMWSHFKLFIMRKAVNATVTSIRKPMIEKFEIPIIPLTEQQRIVSILDKFEALVNDLSQGLPAEIAAVQEQYEYYRNKLLTFNRLN